VSPLTDLATPQNMTNFPNLLNLANLNEPYEP